MTRTTQMTSFALTELQLEQADLILRPNVGKFHWSEFNQIDTIIAEGEKEAERLLPEIKKIVTRIYYFRKRRRISIKQGKFIDFK